ncbi:MULTISPECIES: hypothetical protein [Thermoactinomyces]|nr:MULTISPECIES: hypothetical protein [Thermoactinomyces]
MHASRMIDPCIANGIYLFPKNGIRVNLSLSGWSPFVATIHHDRF